MTKASLSIWIALALVGGALVGCGDDDPSTGGDSGMEADSGGDDDGGPPECEEAADCDDGNACNGDEACTAGACEAGDDADDGTSCDSDADETTAELCVAGACGATRCGDGYVDTATTEICDDGNDVNGDGCDDCRFSCDDAADCTDGNDCNGDETCSAAHVCEAGTALAEDAECAGGTGSCMGGTCLANSCTLPADCDDANVCNGTETCDLTTGCAIGTALDCDDEDACTADSCDAAGGCENALIDADLDGHAPESAGECGTDCDDTRADVSPVAADVCDTIDNDCDGRIDEGGVTTWYADCDVDGYAGAGARTVSSCAMPAVSLSMCTTGGGWTTRAPTGAANVDCNDGNAVVNPGQMMFQTTAIVGAPAAGDFDYNCDAMEEVRTAGMGRCVPAGLGCALTEGWADAPVPACGATASFVTGCTGGLTSCNEVTADRQQACR